MEQTVDTIILLLIVAVYITAPVLRIHASIVLAKVYRLAKKEGLPTGTIKERLFVAVTGSVAVIILGGLGLFRVATGTSLPFPFGAILTAVSLLLLVLPAFVWEFMYLTGRLEK